MRDTDIRGVDLRDLVFESIGGRRYVARITAQEPGILAGTEGLRREGERIGTEFTRLLQDGARLRAGTIVAELTGTPKQIALSEDHLIGQVAKCSGVATAAARAKALGGTIQVVCGAWKKMPVESKQALRRAVETGGLRTRISSRNFVYMDKNYVRMFGTIESTLEAVKRLDNRIKAVQVRGESSDVADEAVSACLNGADIVMIDTGMVADVRRVSRRLKEEGLRGRVELAFAGNVHIEQLPCLNNEDIDILDIGRAVIDAPLLDMQLDVVAPHKQTGEGA